MTTTTLTALIIAMVVVAILLVAIPCKPITPEEYWQHRLEVAEKAGDEVKVMIIKEYIEDMVKRDAEK